MKKFWNNIKTFFGNLKKLYRLSQRISFYDNTILFEGSIETTRHLKAGHNAYCYTRYFPKETLKTEEEYEELIKKDVERGRLTNDKKDKAAL